MWLPKITEVLPEKASHTIIGTSFTTALADAAGLAPVRKDITEFDIDRSNPIVAIRIYVKVNVDVVATAMTPDGIGSILQKVVFQRKSVGASPGADQKRATVDVVNADGIDILQRRWHVAKLDRATATAITTYTVRTAYVLCYHIDLADDQLVDPLRTVTACPVHLDAANPVLKLTFAGQSDMEASGGTAFKLKHLTCEVHIIRAEMPPEVTAKIISEGGFLESELISRDVPFTSNTKQRVEIESPGEYSNIIFTTFSSATARGLINDAADLNYELSVQNKTRRQFTQAGLISENSDSIIETTGQTFTFNNSLDFVSDQLGNAENNLGSLLNANVEQLNGQKTLLLFKGGGANMKLRWTGRRYLTPIGARRFGFA